ncbi:MAG: flagellar basal body-associated FliL family protein [Halobacteriovoraceae bacterium]|nr:flagellar basal body-associated FliL family protein [Halobacteriovoraceae bacterium]MCB9095586.1 flagellar basal body-associated FliL family protein [Halobacteriovoraceae bacterium]
MTGKKSLDNILLALNLLLILGGAGLYIYALQIKPPPTNLEEEIGDLNAATIAQTNIPAIELPSMTVNLTSERAKLNYLNVEIFLVPLNKKLVSHIQNHNAEITSTVIETASAMSPNELATVSGKILLAEKLKNRINTVLRTKSIQRVLFTKFVIQ